MKFTVLSFLSMAAGVSARPDGAPVCPTNGMSAPGAPHRPGDEIEGTLTQGDIDVTIGTCLVPEDGTVEVEVGKIVTVTISRTAPDTFQGVLARFDASDETAIIQGEDPLQVSAPCTAANVRETQ